MRIRKLIVGLTLLMAMPIWADVVTLRNGTTVRGEVVVSNEEVVIVKDANGRRFQYPTSEVVNVMHEEQVVEQPEEEQKKEIGGKKTAILLELAGGGSFMPNTTAGGHIGAELMIGSRYIGNKSIFLGGGLGVHGLMMGGETYTFLPLELAFKVPLIEGKHAPLIGGQIGYGFGVSKNCKGGLFAGVEVGYRYQLNYVTALLVGLNTQFQQTTIDVPEQITENDISTIYINHSGRNLVTFGIRIGFTF